MDRISRIMALSDAFGPSGFEDEAADIVRRELAALAPVRDHMGNLRCTAGEDPGKPCVMLDAHLDETGLIVQAVRPNGTMRFLPLGGWAPTSFPSSAFRIRSRDGQDIPAVVANKPPHFMSPAERTKTPEVADMVLDCGSVSKEETEKVLGIGIGSPAVPDVKCRYDEKRHLFFGKAFDDRIGVECAIETLLKLNGEELPCRLAGSFSVQEEVGERGVLANAAALRPDVMICFEGCPADDTFSEEYMIQAGMRRGPMLRHMDRSMITNHRFQRFALDTARKAGIPVQESVRTGGGQNGAAVYNTLGIPAIVIGVPVRYIHSSYCYCCLEDVDAAVELAVELCRKLDRNTCDSF